MFMGRIRLLLDGIGRWGFFKIMLFAAIIFISLILFFSHKQAHPIVTFLGILSSITEVIMLFVWLKKEEFPVEDIVEIKETTAKMQESMTTVKEYVLQREEEEKRKVKLIKKLIEVGAVREKEIYRLLREGNDVFVVYTYGESIKAKRVRNIAGGKPPLIGLLEEMGFIRVTSNQNLFVIFSKGLPPNLRDTYALRNFIKRELPRRWEMISEEIRQKYPKTKYKILEKWRTKEGFKASFIVMRCLGYEFIIDFLGKISFHPQFRERILRGVDWSRLRKLIEKRKHEIKKFLSKISIEILLENIPKRHRVIILQNEDHIKSKLGLENFTDFRFFEVNEDLVLLLMELLPDLEETTVKKYADDICRESKQYYSMLEELGISLD